MDYKNSLIITSIRTIKNEGPKRFIKYHFFYIMKFKLDYVKDLLLFEKLKFNPNKNKYFIGQNNNDINKVFDYANKYKVFTPSIRPAQLKSEFVKFSNLLKSEKIKNVLEIGTANGGTLYLFSRIINKNGMIVSLDWVHPKWKQNFYKSFALSKQQIFLVSGNSHKKQNLEKVKKIIGNKKFDMLFIDGDHSYMGVKSDFDMYKSLVKNGGIIAFHDIAAGYIVNPRWAEVNKFWVQLKRKYRHVEIIEDKNKQRAFGIGLIYYNY